MTALKIACDFTLIARTVLNGEGEFSIWRVNELRKSNPPAGYQDRVFNSLDELVCAAFLKKVDKLNIQFKINYILGVAIEYFKRK